MYSIQAAVKLFLTYVYVVRPLASTDNRLTLEQERPLSGNLTPLIVIQNHVSNIPKNLII